MIVPPEIPSTAYILSSPAPPFITLIDFNSSPSKIDFPENWVHLRKSNTEPIIRIYTEAKSQTEADTLADKFIKEIGDIANK